MIEKCNIWDCKNPVFGMLKIGLFHVNSGRKTHRYIRFCKLHFIEVLEHPKHFRVSLKRDGPTKAVYISAELE